MANSFVGSKTGGAKAGLNASASIALNSLNNDAGGTSAAQAGDHCLLVITIGTNSGTPSIPTPSGWTAKTALLGSTNTSKAMFFEKRMGATPDTSVTVSGSTTDGDIAVSGTVLVFRGVDPTTPNDVAPATATGGSSYADPPSATPTTAGAWPVALAGIGRGTVAFTNPGDLSTGTNHFATFLAGTSQPQAVSGIGFKSNWTSGTFDPAAWGGATGAWIAATFVLRPEAGTSTAVTTQSATHAQTAGSPSLTAHAALTTDSAAHAQTASEPTLTAKAIPAIDNAAHSQTATEPTLAAYAVLTADSAAHGQTADSPALVARAVLTADGAAHTQTADSPTLAAKSAATVDGATHAHTASEPTLAAKSAATADSATHTQTADSPTLTAKAIQAVSSATHAQTADSPALVARAVLTADNATHGHTASSPTTGIDNLADADSAVHTHTAGSPTLAARSATVPDNAVHAQAATSPSLAARSTVAVNDNTHAHTASQPSLLATAAQVAPASAAHALTNSVIELRGAMTLAPPSRTVTVPARLGASMAVGAPRTTIIHPRAA